MFTGIITHVGRIALIEPLGDSSAHGKRLTLQCPAGTGKRVRSAGGADRQQAADAFRK